MAAVGLLPLLAPELCIPDSEVVHAMLYCLLLPMMAAATPIGILRVLDRFDLIGWQATITPILRGVLTGVAWALDAKLETYLVT